MMEQLPPPSNNLERALLSSTSNTDVVDLPLFSEDHDPVVIDTSEGDVLTRSKPILFSPTSGLSIDVIVSNLSHRNAKKRVESARALRVRVDCDHSLLSVAVTQAALEPLLLMISSQYKKPRNVESGGVSAGENAESGMWIQDMRQSAAGAVEVLCGASDENCSIFLKLGGIQALVRLLSSGDSLTQCSAINALSHCCIRQTVSSSFSRHRTGGYVVNGEESCKYQKGSARPVVQEAVMVPGIIARLHKLISRLDSSEYLRWSALGLIASLCFENEANSQDFIANNSINILRDIEESPKSSSDLLVAAGAALLILGQAPKPRNDVMYEIPTNTKRGAPVTCCAACILQ